MIDAICEYICRLPWPWALLFFLLENGCIVGVSYQAGVYIESRFRHRQLTAPPGPTQTPLLVHLVVSTWLLNTAVTLAGLALYRMEWIHMRPSGTGWDLVDFAVLFVVMDFLMYVLHRVAHHPILYNLLHSTHHGFQNPRALTLFALNPLENLSFGLLWLLVLCCYSPSWMAVGTYLTVNVISGVMGHLGVEPCPDGWPRHRLLGCIATATFHAQHHRDPHHNFGFYTVIWDRLLGTLSPRYETEFGRELS